MKPRQPPVRDQRENHRRGTGGGNDGGGKPKSGASHHLGNRCAIPTSPARLLLYIFENLCPKGAFLTACTFSLQAHSSIRKDSAVRG